VPMKHYGPELAISQELHQEKYRRRDESFEEAMTRVANALADDEAHFRAFRDALLYQRFLPAGRIQAAVGSPRLVTPYNCFVSGIIEDSMTSIMGKAAEAAETMRMGGGIGYDFSRLRPYGDLITTLESRSGGPMSFLPIYNAVCGAIASAGHRRGAQMGVLRVDHPDIEEYVRSKQNTTNLTNFNLSVGVTDEFMQAVISGSPFSLRFNGRVYRRIDARSLWEEIMRSTYDWAEPGVLFLDTANRMNNLWYCETLEATNPCAEQWLPPYGACLLGSFNLTKYVKRNPEGEYVFDWQGLRLDIPVVVRAMDNVVDVATYPLPQQQDEAKSKRRMGLGVTGLANAIEALGPRYGSPSFIIYEATILALLRDETYRASAELAREKGAFPMFDKRYLEGQFIVGLPDDVKRMIAEHGIRNSHLTSIAPTGTISLAADNISSGIEPVFSYRFDRLIRHEEGERKDTVEDYGVRVFGVHGKTTDECTVDDHLNVLLTAQRYIDSSVSKTCNVPYDVRWSDFKNIYMRAWYGDAKGCTTYRKGGKREGILEEGTACFIDPETGRKSCE
jgi:ribonucleoside-diphosphate reductase alpha chain